MIFQFRCDDNHSICMTYGIPYVIHMELLVNVNKCIFDTNAYGLNNDFTGIWT